MILTSDLDIRQATIKLRPADDADRHAIHQLYLSAFAEDERTDVAAVALELLGDEAVGGNLTLVALVDQRIIGHVSFSPVAINGISGRAFILAPLAVDPGFQGQGIGCRLVQEGLAKLSEAGIDQVFVYGDPAYYGRFGFHAAPAEPFAPPQQLEYPFGWQLLNLGASPVDLKGGQLTVVAPLNKPCLW